MGAIQDEIERETSAEFQRQAEAQGQRGLPFPPDACPTPATCAWRTCQRQCAKVRGHTALDVQLRSAASQRLAADRNRIAGINIVKDPNVPEGFMVAVSPAEQAELVEQINGSPYLQSDPVMNPKELAGSKKPATWSVMPRWVVLLVGRVMSVGAAKYGPFNYRESSISASVYQDALERHLQLWFDGEDNDEESGVSHLAHAIACCSLLLDAQATGKLNDDRQKTGLVRKALEDIGGLLKTLPLPQRYVVKAAGS